MADINQVQLPDGSQYNIKDDISGYATETYVQNQISGITKATIGLGNVDNTSDANKPVSTAQQTALDGKTNTSMVAYVESSTTATKRYEIGDQFILNGVLYTATAIIANGGTITVGTNCTASDTIIEQIPNVEGKANKTDLASISETGSTASQAITAGTYFYLNGEYVKAKTDIASGATFTLNTNYVVATVGDNLLSGDLDIVLSTVGSTGSKATSKNMSNYKFLVLALRGSTSGDWADLRTIPYGLFKQLNSENLRIPICYGAANNARVEVYYVDDTHVYIQYLDSNRGFTIWGMK